MRGNISVYREMFIYEINIYKLYNDVNNSNVLCERLDNIFIVFQGRTLVKSLC